MQVQNDGLKGIFKLIFILNFIFRKLNAYNTGLFIKPFSCRETSFERPIAPVRSYIKFNNLLKFKK
jgi:hypothetical protein